ncbi:signal transduction histidine kinase [Marinoscillum furvescens DSM 4134]|uniref:histidine kinase n=1 Tax=Marinoscillum furvescens DSM 4134 TaxID=1122208 RepID=A0A3D9KY56_MARFU|nr:signal transduction histidine kinase [Marinoscillum furvescens DSM 4134]
MLYLIVLLVSPVTSRAQDQVLADSLALRLENIPDSDTSRLSVLAQIANNQTDPRKKLEFANMLVKEATTHKSPYYQHHAYLNEGQAYRLMGDFDVAIYALFKALNFAEKAGYERGVAASNTALADVHSLVGNHNDAVLYYKKALTQLQGQNSRLQALTLLNLGDEYYMSKMYDSALVCFERSKAIYEQLGDDSSGLAYNLGNIGLVKAEQGELEEAERNVRDAIEQLKAHQDHYGIAIFLTYMAEIYQRKGLLNGARSFADSSMRISKRYGLKNEIRDNSLRLADIYAMSSDYETAYKFHQQYVELKDSIANDELYNRMENLESAFELAKKQGEVDLLKARQKNQQIIITTAIIVTIILTLLAIVIFRYYRAKAKINKVLEEQKRSLESLNETKDKFFSIISHDLRGPINSFHGISHMIKHFVKTKDTDQLLEVADDIDRSVDRLSNLLDNLLNWAMQQQGQFPYVPEKLSFNEVAADLLNIFANMAKGKQVRLINDLQGEMTLWADRNTTQTIFRNLISNALKFTPPGGQVKVSGHCEEEKAVIRVSDTGVGMSVAKLNKLFEVHGEKSTFGTAGEKGLGLGLLLVQEFVEMNGGHIEVQSTPHEGTAFTVKLPLFEKHAELQESQ